MRDPTSAEWVIGLITLIGGGAFVAVGAGWYPKLEPGSWAEWVGGIGALLVVLLALFGDEFRRWIFGPKLDISVSTEPPDCVRVPVVAGPRGVNVIDTIYVRIRVRNDGHSLAREVQVFAESLMEFAPGQDWQPVRMFPSMNLTWSDLPREADVKLRMFFPGLGPTMSKHCDLGRIAFHRDRPLVGDHRQGLDVNSNAFAFETIVKPNHQGHIVGPGRYQVRLLLAADNARPAVRTIEVVVRPGWNPDDPAAMLAIRVV